MVDEKFGMSQQCALATQKVNHFLSCKKRRVASRLKEVTLLLRSNEITPGMFHPVLGIPVQAKTLISQSNPKEGHKKDQNDGIPLL